MSTKKNPRFTLIELLMVIAVIAILATLLLPALRKGKFLARGIECVGRKKQIATATQQYLADNNDIYYHAFLGEGVSGDVSIDLYLWDRHTFWAWHMMPYLGLKKWNDSYGYENGIFGCPSRLKKYDSYFLNYFPIGYNTRLFGRYPAEIYGKTLLNRPAVKLSKLRHPAQQLTHTDTGSYDTNTFCVQYRHVRKCTTIFADGHVSQESAKKLQVTDHDMLPWNANLTEKKPVKYDVVTNYKREDWDD